MDKQEKERNKTRCDKCRSTQTYIRKIDNTRHCVKCGHVKRLG